ncbi:hypothetical protein ISCGN_005539 [Ixodes scapularis]
MSKFQKIMYASSPDELDAVTEELQQKSHQRYVARVEAFLERKEEWVLLFRSSTTTRGHNTNNFAEASIPILKDVVLCRRKAFNAVALVDLVATVWEGYFQRRLLNHAFNRVSARHILYDKILQRMPASAPQAVRPLGSHVYQVPSGQDIDKVYEVCDDSGTCSCRADQEGALCKHQALVYSIYGGEFPNAPVLTAQDRHQLGLLALGDECQDASFFRKFHKAPSEQPSTSTAGEQDSAAVVEPLPQLEQAMDTELQLDTGCSTSHDQH